MCVCIHLIFHSCLHTFVSKYKKYKYKQHKHTYILNHKCIETTKNTRMETHAALL